VITHSALPAPLKSAACAVQMGAETFYYLRSFQLVVRSLAERYEDLLDAEERRFIDEFALLPRPAQALLVRMVMRKGRLFRAGRLSYAEIGDTAAAAAPLIERGWLEANPALSVHELFALMTKDELLIGLALPVRDRRQTKAVLLEKLRLQLPQPRPLTKWFGDSADVIYRLTVDVLCERLRGMFFGNFRQDWSEFVLRDLGVVKYETVESCGDCRAFRTRRQFDDFQRLHACRQMLEECADPLEIDRAMPGPIEDCDWLEERRERLMLHVARACERSGDVAQALRMYGGCSLPEARVRVQRIEARMARSGRRGGGAARTRTLVPTFEVAIDAAAAAGGVEYGVRDHLGAVCPDSRLVYVENGLINSLFGLLCWRAIFAPIPGAFFHAFHAAPADLRNARFFERREREFADCFAELEHGGYKRTIRRHFSQKAGIASPFVAWGLMTETLLETALDCFPARHLRLWFEWIARDVRSNCAGFPDLAQFWPQERRYRLIEVKGPGDRLQDNQRRCLEFCHSHAMPVSVCFVRWTGARGHTVQSAAPCS
jgi:hypothetical protein